MIRVHQRPPSHSLIVRVRITSDVSTVTTGDQRRIMYDTSRMRDVCALNGMIRKTGVNTIAMTIAMSTKSVSQTNLRRLLDMSFTSSPFRLSDHCHRPQHSDCKKRREIKQKIPATVSRWRGFDRCDCFRSPLRALQTDADAPELFGVEVYESAILNLARHALTRAVIKRFRQSTAGRLYADLHLEVWRKLSRSTNDHEEQRVANIRIGPK